MNRLRTLIPAIRDNSLGIVLFALFVVCLVGQSLAAWYKQNWTLAAHGHPPISYWDNLVSGSFLESLAVNWQAAILQLGSLILLSAFLYQRGAAHSRDPLRRSDHEQQRERARRFRWLYRNSLFLAFLLLFFITLVLHIVFGAGAYNQERAFNRLPPVSIPRYLVSASFWSSTLSTWQAEYLAIAVYIILSVFLRQAGSAESKPVEAGHDTTGEANR